MNFTTENGGAYQIIKALRARPSKLRAFLRAAAIIAILCLVLLGSTAKAEPRVDTVAHFGMGFMMQTVGMAFSKKALRLDSTDAAVFTLFNVAFASAVWEMSGRSKPSFSDFGFSVLGAGFAIPFSL